jgi:DNA-binding transcriptional MerR regulator
MQKRKFRIGELAEQLNVERFVIRFWEKEFKIKTIRSSGGQRFYQEKDLEKFKLIKELLYKRGFTIAGAKKQLEETKQPPTIIASQKTTITPRDISHTIRVQELEKVMAQLIELRKQLRKLQELL